MDLPSEILCQILAYLPTKRDIKQIRLANKVLAIAGAPYLYDSVQLTATTEDLQRARLIHGHFSHLLKTIIVVLVGYSWLPEPPDSANESDLSETGNKSHLRHRFDTCRRLFVESGNIMSDNSIQQLFKELLKAPRLQKLVVTDTYGPRRGSDNLRAECCPQPQCCKKSRKFHKRLSVLPQPLPAEIFLQFFQSLLETPGASMRIKKLVIVSSKHYYPLVDQTFQMPVVETYHSLLAFSELTSLTLNFGSSRLAGARTPQYKEGQKGCLQLASNLKHLSIDVGAASRVLYERLGMTSFQYVFDGCTFRKLQSLELLNFNSSADELYALLSSSSKLQFLTIRNHSLESGSWYEITEQLAEHSSLVKVNMDEVRGGFDKRWVRDRWSDLSGDINAYLLGDAPNPFSLERLSLWEDKKAVFDGQKHGCL